MAISKRNIMTRYFYIVLFMSLIGVGIVIKAAHIMFVDRDYWKEVASRFKKEDVTLYPNRGNILSGDGKLLASSLPEYYLFLDYKYYDNNEKRQARGQHRRDSIFNSKVDSLAQALNKMFPEWSVAQYRTHLKNGRNSRSWQHYPLFPNRRKRITHTQYKEIQRLPFLNLGKLTSGLHDENLNRRKRPFGSLGMRTIGDVYADTALGAKNGIELAFDSLLRGENGISHRQKVMNRYVSLTDKPPVDGCDIITTIDVDMQDIAEKALVDKLEELEAFVGVAAIMEVKTGEIKAIVNMTRGNDGKYYEMRNNAISDMMEPGSTFKTASIMVALEDGYITPETEVDTKNGQLRMYGSNMKDHNWHRGGYGVIDVTRILEVSSNIGVSFLIDKYYKDNPQRFVDGLKRMSIDQPLNLQIPGEGTPDIKGPEDRKKVGRYFAKTSLPWMSIGYETQVPPLNILTFYNAIANDGVMVRPKLVKAAMKDGKVVYEYPTEIINPKICSDKTLEQIQVILEKVVSQGLAKPAGSKQFPVAGKTGTAQISKGAEGYKSGRTNYLVSFCGYFPADDPKYSCIVSIQKPGLPASGGQMAGSVFSKIAERVYAKNLRFDMQHAIDSTSNTIPDVKAGEMKSAMYVLEELDVPASSNFQEPRSKEQWGKAIAAEREVTLEGEREHATVVPSVVGMGAKDAVYLLEKKGLKVRINGVGRVSRQSVPAGNTIQRGQTVVLTMKREG